MPLEEKQKMRCQLIEGMKEEKSLQKLAKALDEVSTRFQGLWAATGKISSMETFPLKGRGRPASG